MTGEGLRHDGGTSRTTRGRRTAILALVILLGTVAPAGTGAGGPAGTAPIAATATTAPTEIAGCTTIDEPGQYVLTADVENGSATRPDSGLGACIAVRASDVTLRGGNHTVAAGAGGRPGVVGVSVGGDERLSNVTVRNLTVTRWGAGVAAIGVSNAAFRNVSAVNNLGDGFFVENASDASIVGGTVRGSNTGVFVRRAPNARVADLTVAENLAGISIRRSDGAAVEDVNASLNRQYGVGLFASANATVADSTLRANGFAGVALSRADDAHLRNLTVGPVATLAPGAGDPVGVYLNDSGGVHLRDVSVTDGPGWAIYATGDSTATGERVRVGRTALSFEARDVSFDSAEDSPPLPTERQIVGEPLFVAPTDGDAHLSLSVRYADAAVERARTIEDTLSLWRSDAGGDWRRVETTLDAERNAASATFEELAENGTVVSLVGEGLAESETKSETESGNETESENETETGSETETEGGTETESERGTENYSSAESATFPVSSSAPASRYFC